MESSFTRAYQLAYLLVGESGGAVQALLETLRLHPRSDGFPWYELALTARRYAADLSPDRFFLRSLANQDGLTAPVDRLPETERTALVLDASAAFTPDEIASLLRLPKDPLPERLTRLWRQVDVERTELWPALLATVPPIPSDVQCQLLIAFAGEGPSSQSGERPHRRLPVIGVALAVAVTLLFAFRWWPRPESAMAPTAELVSAEVEAPEGPLNLRPYRPHSLVGLTTYDGYQFPMSAGLNHVAEKVLQWLGEARVVGEDPAATPGAGRLSLRLHFADDETDLWLTAPDSCLLNEEPCLVTVGGASAVPLVVEQVDLGRWMTAFGWLELQPDYLGVLRSSTDRRFHAEEVTALPALEMGDGKVAERPTKVDVLVTYRDPDGAWRTDVKPAWGVFVHPTQTQEDGEVLFVSDETGNVIHRRTVSYGRTENRAPS